MIHKTDRSIPPSCLRLSIRITHCIHFVSFSSLLPHYTTTTAFCRLSIVYSKPITTKRLRSPSALVHPFILCRYKATLIYHENIPLIHLINLPTNTPYEQTCSEDCWCKSLQDVLIAVLDPMSQKLLRKVAPSGPSWNTHYRTCHFGRCPHLF